MWGEERCWSSCEPAQHETALAAALGELLLLGLALQGSTGPRVSCRPVCTAECPGRGSARGLCRLACMSW